MNTRKILVALLTTAFIGLGPAGQVLAYENDHREYRHGYHEHSYNHERFRPRIERYERHREWGEYHDRYHYPRYRADHYYGAYGLGVITGILLNESNW